MRHRRLAVLAMLIACAVASACGDSKSPVAPEPGVASLAVRLLAGGTIYIGAVAQLQATATLSDGTTRAAAATWSSDAPTVATVSQTGILTGVGAGEATIAADTNTQRGALRVRVYPNFNGAWSGLESAVSCDDSGDFEGLCSDPDVYTQGGLFTHDSSYAQTDAAVSVTLDLGGGMVATGPGAVAVSGQLQLQSARAMPQDPNITVDVENLQFRSDAPARLTGTYLGRFSSPGLEGSVVFGIRLEGVTRSAAVAAGSQRRANGDRGAVLSRWKSLQQKLTRH